MHKKPHAARAAFAQPIYYARNILNIFPNGGVWSRDISATRLHERAALVQIANDSKDCTM
jgi:hypothetical protein